MSKFPLPRDFFRCPQLSEKDVQELLTFAESTSMDFVRYSQVQNGPVEWTLLEDGNETLVYRGRDPTAPPGVISYCATTEVYATIDEVAELFRSETPQEYEEYCRQFAKDILDGALLYKLSMPTHDNPRHFVGVRWMALTSPVPAVIKHRDFCSIESRYDFELDGRRGWMRTFKAIKLACCPDLEMSLGLVRGSYHRVGLVFVESTRPGYLQAVQLMQLDSGGNCPTWLLKFSAKRRAKNIRNIELYLRERRLCRTDFIAEANLIQKNNRSRCFLCQRRFGTFATKHSCRKCGEVMCKSCSRTWNVHVTKVPQSFRVCTACSLGTTPHVASYSTGMDDNRPRIEQPHYYSTASPLSDPRGYPMYTPPPRRLHQTPTAMYHHDAPDPWRRPYPDYPREYPQYPHELHGRSVPTPPFRHPRPQEPVYTQNHVPYRTASYHDSNESYQDQYTPHERPWEVHPQYDYDTSPHWDQPSDLIPLSSTSGMKRTDSTSSGSKGMEDLSAHIDRTLRL